MKTLGDTLRDVGVKLVSENSGDFMDDSISLIKLIGHASRHRQLFFTGEDLRVMLTDNDITPHHSNAWGALILTLNQQKVIRKTGQFVKMTDPRSQSRLTPLYEFALR